MIITLGILLPPVKECEWKKWNIYVYIVCVWIKILEIVNSIDKLVYSMDDELSAAYCTHRV